MRAYLELKDQVADPPHPNPTYPDRPNAPYPMILQAFRNRMAKESKKRSRSQQAGRRKYKVRLIEKPLVLSRALTTLIPITTIYTAATPLPTCLHTVVHGKILKKVFLYCDIPLFSMTRNTAT